ncbi:MAG: hypothetical protein WEB60_08485 [Terrimicrobiaceae bacterium]
MVPADQRLEQLRTRGGCFPVGPRTRLRVSGADSRRYLNGQLSNNLTALPEHTAIPALLLTAKGKLCAVVFVWSEGNTFIVDSDPEVAESLQPRLERYVVADDVTMEDLSSESTGWHVFGTSLPAGSLQISRLGVPGCDVPAPPDHLLEATPQERELLRIERGIPQWGKELGPDTLPHEAGLDRTAVDFHKGCYVGQEVVSRIESVGRANRMLCGFVGDFPADQATTLVTPSGQPAGTITSAALHFGMAQSVALGYLSSRISENHFLAHDENGKPLGECQRHEFPLV